MPPLLLPPSIHVAASSVVAISIRPLISIENGGTRGSTDRWTIKMMLMY